MVHFRQIHSARQRSFSYLLADSGRREALLIDPAADETTLYLALLDEIQSRLGHILLTHHHGEDLASIAELRAVTGAMLVVGERCPLDDDAGVTRVGDGDIVVFGDELLRCRTTPGHTPGCMSFFWRDRVFVGDVLPSSSEVCDPGAQFDSLTRKLLTLPDEALLYPAHEFGGRRVTCIAEARDSAITGATRDEFIAKQRPAPLRVGHY